MTSLNDIISAVSKKLHDEFGAGCEIYTEPVKQGLKPPCFRISCVESAVLPAVGARYRMENLFSIVFFPASVTAAEAECRDTQAALFPALEFIEVGGVLVRGTGMGGRIIEGTLVFTLNYNLSVQRNIEHVFMDRLETPMINANRIGP